MKRKEYSFLDIKDLVASASLEDYIGKFVELKPQNHELFGLCPFHKENTPSFSVTPNNKKWYCFGCGRGGDIVDFIKLYHNVEFKEAFRILQEYLGCDTSYSHPSPTAQIFKKFQEKGTSKSESQPNHLILPDDYMNQFKWDLNHLSSWIEEGISSEILELFQVRYDEQRNRIVFPIRSPDGTIIDVSGRSLNDTNAPKYTYLYPLGALDTIYGWYEHREECERKKEIILFEGAKSVMKLQQLGIHNSGAILGCHLNREQLKLLIQFGLRVVFALDKEIDITLDKNILKLTKFVKVEWVKNRDDLLSNKMSPIDAGRVVWEFLYRNREAIN